MGESLLAIGEVVRRTGLRHSALRYYEDAGLLEPAQRVNGRRLYDERSLQRLRVIDVAKTAGFTLAEIRVLLEGFDTGAVPSERWRALAHGKLAEIDETIARAERMRATLQEGLSCDCLRIEDCALVAAPDVDRASA